jgi:hypothetical protein
MLAVGRFAFLPFQRRTQDKSQAVGPKTTGAFWRRCWLCVISGRAGGGIGGLLC